MTRLHRSLRSLTAGFCKRPWALGAAVTAVILFWISLPSTQSAVSTPSNDDDKKVVHPWLDKKSPYGLAERVQWTTSKVSGSPDPADPYSYERIFPHIRLDRPLDIQPSPDGSRWFVCEDPGVITTFPVENPERADTFLDIRRKDHKYLQWFEQRRIWSIAFHPKYPQNGYVYVAYIDPKPKPTRMRIARFTVDLENVQEPPTCDVDSEFIVAEWQAGIDHFGGCLKFGKDGFLYFSAGDGGAYGDDDNSGQNISDFNASILRIDVDGKDNGKAYAIPKDNPFVNVPGAAPEVWAFGTRNIWKMSFDRETGDLWGGDVGQDLWDSIYKIERGGNYGWSVMEGSHTFKTERKLRPEKVLKPVVEHEHSEARSITGGFVYRGKRLPELFGYYIYGDFDTGKIWGLKYVDGKATDHRQLVDTPLKLVAFGEDHDGELVILDYQGTINQLIPAKKVDIASAPSFPRLLSKTGLFSSTKEMVPATGLIPYSVNSPLWSDGAAKERYIAIPGDGKIQYQPNGGWTFPEGTVIVKTFSLEMEKGNPKTLRRLETRLLHLEQQHWRGYTYIWNDAQTEAALCDKAGADQTFKIKDAAAPGGTREQKWHFPSHAECSLCHTNSTNFVLGLSTVQMNKLHAYDDGVQDNQLRALEHIGLFTKPLATYYKQMPGMLTPPPVPAIVSPQDETASLNDRARSYLHANCSHCHMRSGGGNSQFEVPISFSLAQTRTVGTPPRHGNLGIEAAQIVVSGDPDHSLLLERMIRTDESRMPRAGSSVVDTEGAKLIRSWIKGLGDARPQ